jgi:exonuclease III
MNNANRSYQMMSWNVRGFNNPSRQEEVKQVVSTFKPDVICLQETKLSEISNSNVRNILGPEFELNYCYLPIEATRGASC